MSWSNRQYKVDVDICYVIDKFSNDAAVSKLFVSFELHTCPVRSGVDHESNDECQILCCFLMSTFALPRVIVYGNIQNKIRNS